MHAACAGLQAPYAGAVCRGAQCSVHCTAQPCDLDSLTHWLNCVFFLLRSCSAALLVPCVAACLCSDALDQPLPVAAAANEQYKKAKGLGLGDADFAAVYEAGQLAGKSAAPASS